MRKPCIYSGPGTAPRSNGRPDTRTNPGRTNDEDETGRTPRAPRHGERAGAGRHHRCLGRGDHAEHGGARLAADADHEGAVRHPVQGALGQRREAGDRLHSLAGLLHPAQCLAHLGRAEVQHGRVRQPVARRLHRGRLLPPAQRPGRRRPRARRRCSTGCIPRRSRPTAPIPTSRTTSTASRRCRTFWSTYARSDVLCHEAEQAAFQEKYGEKLPCTPEELDAMDWDMFEKIGEFFQRKKGDMLPARPGRGRFLRDLLPGRQGLRLQLDAGQRVPLAAGRRHLGRDRHARRTGRGRRELAGSGRGARALPVAAAVHAAGGQDRQHGHLRDRRAVPRGQDGAERQLDRFRRELDQSRDLQGRRQRGLRKHAGHHAGRRHDRALERTSAASPS